MLIAVKINRARLVEVYHWSPGGCATLNSSGWAGWSTVEESSHPSQSKDEFVHKCLTNPGNFFIKADEDGIVIMKDKETILRKENEL